MRHTRTFLFLLVPALAGGQATAPSVTVTAVRPAQNAGGRAAYGITVEAAFERGLQDILALLAGTGVTAADLAEVGSPYSGWDPPLGDGETVSWFFRLIVPAARMPAVNAALTGLQQKLAGESSGPRIRFSLEGMQTYPPAPQQKCDWVALLAEARAEAQKLAEASGTTAGAVLNLSAAMPAAADCWLSGAFALGAAPPVPARRTVTVFASRTESLPADSIWAALLVVSALDARQEEIAPALAAAGIAGARFFDVRSTDFYDPGSRAPRPALLWEFGMRSPLTAMKDLAGSVAAARKKLAERTPPLGLVLRVLGPYLAPETAGVRSCSHEALLAGARAYAEEVAAAAQAGVGAVTGIGQTIGGVGAPAAFAAFGSIREPVRPPSCAATVHFELE